METPEEIVHRVATYIAKRILRDKTLTECLNCGRVLTCASCGPVLELANIGPFGDRRETRIAELVTSEMEEGISALVQAAIEERVAEVKHAVAIHENKPSVERAALQATYMIAIKKRREAVDALVIAPGH